MANDREKAQSAGTAAFAAIAGMVVSYGLGLIPERYLDASARSKILTWAVPSLVAGISVWSPRWRAWLLAWWTIRRLRQWIDAERARLPYYDRVHQETAKKKIEVVERALIEARFSEARRPGLSR